MKLKKTTMCILSLIMTIASVLGVAGCKLPSEKLISSGDFLYWVAANDLIYLENLSEDGKQKETIVIPYQIDGYDVWHYTYRRGVGPLRGCFESEALKQLYILPNVSIRSITFELTPNLEKVVLIGTNLNALSKNGWIESTNPYGVKMYISNIDNYELQADEQGNVLRSGYPFHYDWEHSLRLTNCNFMYNYEGADNDGYYWADYFEYGEKIGYIPENPKREGYIFSGWYKDAEGVNIWNFETDTLPEAQYNEEEQELYQETRLYAKWYQN